MEFSLILELIQEIYIISLNYLNYSAIKKEV